MRWPQALHSVSGAKPRRLRNSSACSLALQRDLHRFGEPRRDEAAARRPLAAQIDGLDRRQMLAAEPLRQMQVRVAAALGIHHGLDRRRRRGEHDRDFRLARAHHRHVAGVIAHAVLLLVGGVVLLIDDDQARDRRTAETAPSARRPPRDTSPAATADQVRARFRGAISECHSAGRTPKRSAKRSRNCAVSAISGIRISTCLLAPDRLGHRLEIDLGLARAGDAVDQRHREAALRRRSRAAHRPPRAARR